MPFVSVESCSIYTDFNFGLASIGTQCITMCWPHASYAKMAELIDIAFGVEN